MVEAEAKRLENENKLKLLDAISSYPKAMKVKNILSIHV